MDNSTISNYNVPLTRSPIHGGIANCHFGIIYPFTIFNTTSLLHYLLLSSQHVINANITSIIYIITIIVLLTLILLLLVVDDTKSNDDCEDNYTTSNTRIRPLFFISLFYGERSDIKG